MKCIVIRHLAFEDLGTFAPVLAQRGFEIDYRQAGVQTIGLQEWLQADLAIVLGGPIGVCEQLRYPWLAQEIGLVRQRLHAGRPLLGVCLGAQLMAAALGARVYPGSAKEIGWSTLRLSGVGLASPLRWLAQQPVLHWHGDVIEPPVGAMVLASTDLAPVQAFAVGRHALALQFHVEVQSAAIESWLIGHTVELSQAGIDLAALRQATRKHGAGSARAAGALLHEWISGLK